MSTKNSMGIRARKTLNNALTYLLLTLLACVILIPIFFVIVTSFKTDSEISLQNFQWLPHSLNIDAFKTRGNWSIGRRPSETACLSR